MATGQPASLDGEVVVLQAAAGDQVTAVNFADSNTDVNIKGESYSAYTGNSTEATLLVDNDISVSLA